MSKPAAFWLLTWMVFVILKSLVLLFVSRLETEKMEKKPISKETRYAIAALHKTKKFTQAQIASQCKVSRKCVQTTVRNLTENGSPLEKKRLGPEQNSTQSEDLELFELARKNPTKSALWLSKEWRRDGVPIASRASQQTSARIQTPILRCGQKVTAYRAPQA